jgi:hypothetical protein
MGKLNVRIWAVPWLLLLLLGIGGLFVVGEGSFPWKLYGEVRAVESRAVALESTDSSPAAFRLPVTRNPQQRASEVLRKLEELRSRSGIVLEEVRPEEAATQKSLVRVPFSLTARADTESLVAFLELAEQTYPSLLIQQLQITSSAQGLQVQIKATDRSRLEVREDD